MRKIQGISNLVTYLESVNYPVAAEQITELMLKRKIPHRKAYQDIVIFNLEHIDWWIAEQQKQQITENT
ncbi:hypothetical protein [Planococcus donghaensis]|uniref:DNA-binding protein n=1 Tax=Planococcus donghaensis TaxID=414778 RepID=A0A1C7ELF3_9BACL|nr:hypothetical protein [Planococcus donghaensis]ANU24814.1 hypothetical protein BCM40_06010 [Planococcus donghaensis]